MSFAARPALGHLLALVTIIACGKTDGTQKLMMDAAKMSSVGDAADTSPRVTTKRVDSLYRAMPMPTTLDTALTRTIRTTHYTLRVPAAVTIDTGTIHPEDPRGLRIRGPVMRDSSGIEQVAYELVIAEYPNPGRTPLNHWVDSLRQSRNAELPKENAWTAIAPAWAFHAGDEPALLVDFFCGDCGPFGVFVGRGDSVLGFYFTSEQGRAISGPQQLRMAIHILDTFRWIP